MNRIVPTVQGVILCLSCINSIAQSDPLKTKRYSIFNPVPKSEMREFSIDRPDITESPVTVDAGHFQFEGELYKWTRVDWSGSSARLVNYFNGLYKMGLTKSWDIHVGVEMFNQYLDSEGNTIKQGYGNTTIRLKHNFYGNEGETRSALGIIPYITLPTSPIDHKAFFGVGFPFTYTLNDRFGIGAQAQFDFIPTESSNYNMDYLQTFTFGGTLVGDFDFFLEGMSILYQGSAILTFNEGLVYSPADNVKIDVGANIGVTDKSLTRIFCGISFRL
jgi:hypothetical protein